MTPWKIALEYFSLTAEYLKYVSLLSVFSTLNASQHHLAFANPVVQDLDEKGHD